MSELPPESLPPELLPPESLPVATAPLWLPQPLLDRLCTLAAAALPHECCGLLLGNTTRADEPGDRAIVVRELWPAPNDWEQLADKPFRDLDPLSVGEVGSERRYAIAPKTFLAAMRAARSHQLDIIGVYHSHPQQPAIPSEFDRACAWPNYSYLILSVRGDRVVDWQSWRLDDHQLDDHQLDDHRQFQAEAIVLI
ncbi:MAG: M67 family peptidase [Oscillatoriales cyanobacterium]|nr:MAG: M67 family peptidase [Oscillatoriales cyanobacterium]